MPTEHMIELASKVREALNVTDLSAFSDLLDPGVRWGAPGDQVYGCHNREEVIAWYNRARRKGMAGTVTEVVVGDEALLVGLHVTGTEAAEEADGAAERWQVMRVRGGRVVDIRGYPDRAEAAIKAGVGPRAEPRIRPMGAGQPISASWSKKVPESVRPLSTMSGPDYTDGFLAAFPEPPAMSPAELIHEAFESAPLWLRLVTPLAQRYVLGLSIERRSSPDNPLGWRVTGGGSNWVRLEASSSFLSGQVVGLVEGHQVSMGTFVRYDRPIGRFIWPPVSLVHRHVGITLLRSAAKAKGSANEECRHRSTGGRPG